MHAKFLLEFVCFLLVCAITHGGCVVIIVSFVAPVTLGKGGLDIKPIMVGEIKLLLGASEPSKQVECLCTNCTLLCIKVTEALGQQGSPHPLLVNLAIPKNMDHYLIFLPLTVNFVCNTACQKAPLSTVILPRGCIGKCH